jgi:plastocyanin
VKEDSVKQAEKLTRQTISGALASGALIALVLSACDAGNAASPQHAAATDSGLTNTGSFVQADAGTATDAGEDGSPMDAGPGVNGCTTYVDHTADAVVNLVWDFPIASAPDHCSKIKVGAAVKWTGNFGTHPLEAFNGDANNPISSNDADGGPDVTITFPAAGAFGYNCAVHASMFGAVLVVP